MEKKKIIRLVSIGLVAVLAVALFSFLFRGCGSNGDMKALLANIEKANQGLDSLRLQNGELRLSNKSLVSDNFKIVEALAGVSGQYQGLAEAVNSMQLNTNRITSAFIALAEFKSSSVGNVTSQNSDGISDLILSTLQDIASGTRSVPQAINIDSLRAVIGLCPCEQTIEFRDSSFEQVVKTFRDKDPEETHTQRVGMTFVTERKGKGRKEEEILHFKFSPEAVKAEITSWARKSRDVKHIGGFFIEDTFLYSTTPTNNVMAGLSYQNFSNVGNMQVSVGPFIQQRSDSFSIGAAARLKYTIPFLYVKK